MTPFELMKKHYQERDLAARKWKQEGGKVVGYFCNNVPEEMISAAGFFPFRLSGDPHGGLEEAQKRIVPNLWPEREDFVNSMFNQIITGKTDFIDYLVISHARVSIHSLKHALFEMKAIEPDIALPELYYLDNLHTPFYSSGLYNRDRWIDFKKALETWSGKPITSDALAKAIEVHNENRRLLKDVAALRAGDSPKISGAEALVIIGSSFFMLKQDHNKLLSDYLNDESRFLDKAGVRLFLAGSPLDNLQLYDVIESLDAVVVGEDNCWGNRHSDLPVDTDLDPLEAIVERYNDKTPCSRMYPMQARVAYCLKSAEEARAQGVIFNIFEDDDMEAWETPAKLKALEEKNVPALHLRKQPYLISEPEALMTRIKEFIHTI